MLVDSVSKRYSMCGARIGALISKNHDFMEMALKFGQARLSPPTLGQIAGEAALKTPHSYFEQVSKEYVERRDIIVNGLNNISGVICPKPQGAFYAIAQLPIDDADHFCQWILESFNHEGSTVMMAPASGFSILAIIVSRQMYLPDGLATSKTWFYIFLILFSFCSLPMFSLILAHTNDFIPKEKFVAAGASLQFTFGMGAMGGPFLCSIFMGIVGPNGFFIFLLFFHSLIGVYGIYRSRVRPVVENPDSQFVAMPQSITPAGIELNPSTEPIEEPIKPVTEPVDEENKPGSF